MTFSKEITISNIKITNYKKRLVTYAKEEIDKLNNLTDNKLNFYCTLKANEEEISDYLQRTSNGDFMTNKVEDINEKIEEWKKNEITNIDLCIKVKESFVLFIKKYLMFSDYSIKTKITDNGVSLPSRLSENLCRYLYNMKIYKDPKKLFSEKFDAELEGKLIEIKSTVGPEKDSSTQVNYRSKFDFLYWMRFDLIEKELVVKIAEYQEVYEALENRHGKTKLTSKETPSRLDINLINVAHYTQAGKYSLKRDNILEPI